MSIGKSERKHSFSRVIAAAGAVLILAAVIVAGGFSSPMQSAHATDDAGGQYLAPAELSAQDGGITRAEWIARLVETFEMTIEANEDEYPDDYFEDVPSGHEHFLDIMKATDFGVIDTPAGELFRPDDPATREFAAHTLNYCLGYQPEEDTALAYTNAETAYPEDMQVALDHEWFGSSKVDDAKENLSTAESDQLTTTAQAVLAETKALMEQADNVQLAPGVKVVPLGTAYTLSDDNTTLTIADCPFPFR